MGDARPIRPHRSARADATCEGCQQPMIRVYPGQRNHPNPACDGPGRWWTDDQIAAWMAARVAAPPTGEARTAAQTGRGDTNIRPKGDEARGRPNSASNRRRNDDRRSPMTETEQEPKPNPGRCEVCKEDLVPGGPWDIVEHVRVIHPDLYGDGPQRWPDGGLVVHEDPDDEFNPDAA